MGPLGGAFLRGEYVAIHKQFGWVAIDVDEDGCLGGAQVPYVVKGHSPVKGVECIASVYQ